MSELEQKELIKSKKGEILEALLIEKSFKEDGVIIRKWEGEPDAKDYISEIKKGDIHFIGVLDSNLVKKGYGYMSLPNNENYFGMYEDDLRTKHGLYQYPDKIKGDKIEREFFFGVFKEGNVDNRGVYLWIEEDKNVPMFNNFDDADFSCFIGDLNSRHFIEGTYMTKKGDNYYVYHGKFNELNQKEGDGAFYYNSEKDELMYGKVEKNKFINAYLSVFNNEGIIKNGIFVIFDEKGKITDYKQKEELPDKSKIFDKMFDFRNIILGEDYFGQVFNTFKDTKEFLDSNLNLESFDSKDKFSKLINASFNFNQMKIKEDIDKVLAKYE